MRKLIVSEFVTLDGVMEAPEKWVFQFHDEPSAGFKTAEINEVDALLLGRRTYEIFAASWPAMTGELADRMNGIRKYVASAKPGQLDWHNSEALTGDAGGAVSALKQRPGGNILLAGSGSLARTLAQRGLVDEYRLFICPVVLGTGERLFNLPSAARSLTLTETRTFDSGALLVRYATA